MWIEQTILLSGVMQHFTTRNSVMEKLYFAVPYTQENSIWITRTASTIIRDQC
jgi:hypothetical protein